jgi:alkylhydroperoxidase family enzyme
MLWVTRRKIQVNRAARPVRLVRWMARRFGWSRVSHRSSPYALAGYLALGRRPGFSSALEARSILLAGGFAAQLSGCRWCIDRTSHDWRVAGFPQQILEEAKLYSSSRFFTDRERAVLAFVEAVASSAATSGTIEQARELLSEDELAELTAIVAEHHCLETLEWNRSTS